jgi:polyhydroxyalkanoate synthesis regulator phasin
MARSTPPQEEAAARRSARAEASLQAFRDALSKSVTISRERLEEIADDAVRRGRMTRTDAEELVSRVISRGRDQADDILRELERLRSQLRELGSPAATRERAGAARRRARRAGDRARREVSSRAERARLEVETRAERARRRTVAAVDQPLARADRVRRRARLPGFPISAYDQLTVRQIHDRLAELTRAELRKVRDYERRNRGRKGVLRAVDRKLND